MTSRHSNDRPHSQVRDRIHEVVFEADTPMGKAFDVVLLIFILLSVLTVMLESVESIALRHGPALRVVEWMFTGVFTVEYALRIYSVDRPARYAGSFFGIVDLLSILPTFMSLIFEGAQSLLIIRGLRLLRIFRVLKLAHFVGEATVLARALSASRPKITVFLIAVLNITAITGALMYLIEGEEAGFTNIPLGMYWAIVTVTTVGYGDIAPITPIGQILASLLMVMGYGIIAVPTGIVTSEIVQAAKDKAVSTQCCPVCSAEGHDIDAVHCKYCGGRL